MWNKEKILDSKESGCQDVNVDGFFFVFIEQFEIATKNQYWWTFSSLVFLLLSCFCLLFTYVHVWLSKNIDTKKSNCIELTETHHWTCCITKSDRELFVTSTIVWNQCTTVIKNEWTKFKWLSLPFDWKRTNALLFVEKHNDMKSICRQQWMRQRWHLKIYGENP